MLRPDDFFDLSDARVGAFFEGCGFVWEAISQIGTHVARLTEASKRF